VTPLQAGAVFLAGVGAGTINTVVGSGTLITFPVLLSVGYPPVLANVSNTVGLFPGSISGAVGYRAELGGQRRRLVVLGTASVVGSVVGGLLLLRLPADAFRLIVPALIVLACVLVLLQPRLSRRVRAGDGRPNGGVALYLGVLGAGVYGGYFGAAQGVLLIALLGLMLDEDLQRINAAKNVLAALVNIAAAALFVVASDVAWAAAGLIAVGSVLGGQLGARVGRRLSPTLLRLLVVAVGLVAIVRIVLN
jgi:uncharacterized membrane protein YfcA